MITAPQNAGKTLGTKPTAAVIPPPGTHCWIRETEPGSYWINEKGGRVKNGPLDKLWSVYTWEEPRVSEWFLARVEDTDGRCEVLASDEGYDWETTWHVVTHCVPLDIAPPPTVERLKDEASE